ncbi:3-deoxy-manno-octulosonate cytidylyltransferase [Neolewinella maritima]|uniref:3-deoxy-manno-octulosonate cytidylyltransferase n=1 Tax=Neolewinella maritima TaxID=1383882 RepID=A0ABM9AZU9_9BACT|nr:3-deoxy-manno-octulosonate cytidylyltransferase [Neolewinella maritima]CAH1000299.1 3-deoxy-manno-octulosonate cytidylyltransferase [Neolewinella maritima]
MRLAVIPARYASSRFPGKPLADLGGCSLIERVYTAVTSTGLFDTVVVATDDERIVDVVEQFGGSVVMTSPSHPSGTDRVAEASRFYPAARIVVNVQGDEPFVRKEELQQLLAAFDDEAVAIATLATVISEESQLLSPNVVKVVRDSRGGALYFSRHAIPFLRDVPLGRWIQEGKHLQHIGVYAYRADVLQSLTKLAPAALETDESLEQLRWLNAGYRIHVSLTDHPAIGIDTPADLEAALRMLS